MKEIARIFRYATGLNKFIVSIAILSLVVSASLLVTPFVIKYATDVIVAIASGQGGSLAQLWPLLAIIGGSSLLVVVLNSINGYLGDILAARLRQQLSERYYQHLLALPQSYYDETETGKIINRLSRAISDISQFINQLANNFLQMLITVGVSIAIMWWYSPWVAVIIGAQIPVYIFLGAQSSKKWTKFQKQHNTLYDKASSRFAEVIGQMKVVKSFNSQQREYASFQRRFGKMVGITYKQSRHWYFYSTLRTACQAVVYTAVYAILFIATAQRAMSIGDMVLLLTLVQQTRMPLQFINFYIDMYQKAVTNSQDYEEVMRTKPDVDTGSKDVDVAGKDIVYDKVSFAYGAKDKRVLQAVSFTIPAGSRVALVGASGGGKSTLANLLMRLYEPQSGAIVIGGVAISDMPLARLRNQIATVFQEAALFSGTIRENIAYGMPWATDEQIQSAAKQANAYEFIMELPKGFDTKVGERGTKLSGGQKQRIAIARAILKDAPILILDEATSALDTRSERAVQEALDRLMQGRTVLIIAHRLSTIAEVDKIITLKRGKVDEIGAPAELAKSGGIYNQLLDLQMGGSSANQKKLKKYDIAV